MFFWRQNIEILTQKNTKIVDDFLTLFKFFSVYFIFYLINSVEYLNVYLNNK